MTTKYYQINTVSGNCKPISETAANRKIVERDFIEWYNDGENVFIADCAGDKAHIVFAILKRLGKIDIEYFTDL